MTLRFMHSVVFCIAVSMCGISFAKDDTRPANSIVVQFGGEPTQYDPLFMEDGTALRIAANVIATPFEYDGAGELKKSLVSSISASRDKKKYTIRFKKDLRWSDGEKFHARQFLAAIQRLVKEPVKAALSELFPEFDLARTKVIDSLTVEVALKEPTAKFENWLSLPPFSPIRDDLLDAFAKRNPVVPTLAAYQVVDYKREDSLLLKKNPEYYDADSVKVETVKIRFLKDESSLLSLFKSGDVDVLCKVPVLQYEAMKKVGRVIEVPVEAVTYLGLNTRKAPFDDIHNRRAFRYSVFKGNFELAEILKTGEMAAVMFLPPSLNPGSIKTDAMMEKKPGVLEFRIQSDASSRNQTMLEFIQDQVKSDFKWKAKLEIMDWKTHYATLKSSPMEAFRFGWQNPVSDPYVLYQVLESTSPNNFTGWKNAEYDRLLKELKQETVSVKKMKLIQKLEKILADEAPVIPLLHQVLRFANSKRVHGFRANSFGVILFREIRLAQN